MDHKPLSELIGKIYNKKIFPASRPWFIELNDVAMPDAEPKKLMGNILLKLLRFLVKPFVLFYYDKRLPNFSKDFKGKRSFMLVELPGGERRWTGRPIKKAKLPNTDSWGRYFNGRLKTAPQTIAEMEHFLYQCRYLSDQVTRNQLDYWEPPDVFEQRKSGDCEDHAIWAWRHLHDLGYRARFVIGDCEGGCHAWVYIFTNGRAYLFEATQKHNWLPDPRDYSARCSVEFVDEQRCVFYLHTDAEKQICTPIQTEQRIYSEIIRVFAVKAPQ